MMVFGRDRVGAHPLFRGLGLMMASSDIYSRAVARNVMHDHRVTPTREAKFLSGTAVANLEFAIRSYFESSVRVRHLPDYVYGRLNHENILTDTATRPRGVLGRDFQLVRLLNLNRLYPVYEA